MAANVKDIAKVSEIKPIKLNSIPKDIKDYNAALSAVSEAQAEAGNALKKLEKERGYNRAAFKLGCSLAKKTVQKRQDFLMTLDAIREKLGWDNEQGDMLSGANVVPIGGKKDEDEEDGEDEAPPVPQEQEGERVLQS